MKKIILVDGNSLMFRSYYATAYTGNLMQNKQGIYTNAIFGFINMMSKIIEEEKTNLFVAFDAGSKTFRHKQLDTYKGTRKKLPDELLMQIPYIKKYLDILNIKQLEMDEYEADDLIASMAFLAKEENFDVIKIITGDKDLLQLVGGNITVGITRKGVGELEEFNENNFVEKMGFTPLQVPDYKGLVGDSSDNLVGIKGIGEKTAVKLLNEYQTLENIIAHVDEIKGKLQETIRNGMASGIECKMLATLKTNVDMGISLSDTSVKYYDVNSLIAFYKELEFETFINRMNIEVNEEVVNYTVVDDDNFDFSNIKDSTIVLEVFGTNYLNSEVLGLSIYNKDISLFVTKSTIINNSSLKDYLEGNKFKRTFDLKRLYVVLSKLGITINNVVFDLLLGSYVINPSYANDDFKTVVSSYGSFFVDADENIYGSKSKANIPSIDVYANNSIKKCMVIDKLHNTIIEKLKDNDQIDLFNMEMKLSIVLGKMEIDGLKIDKKNLERIGLEFLEKQEYYAKEIYKLAGEEFNINSVKQLGVILFEKLGLPTGKKNKTGYSTNVDVLEKLSGEYEIARLILDYRTISKLISTYINGLSDLMTEDGFVHPLYKQALTVTGRLSSIEPNIQNMPIRTEVGQVIREMFVSRFTNGKIMSSDYSQIELRVLAHISNDENMIRMFNNNADFHKQTASQMYEVSLDDVTKEQRRAAKAINFGIIYGMSAWGLSESISINPADAAKYIEKYFDTFKSVKTYLDDTIKTAKENGYTKTLFNRIRFLPEINSSNKALVGFGERTAMNSPIQGTAADIIKFAMIDVEENIKNLKSKMIAQVHDELVFDVYPGEEEILSEVVKKSMENVTLLKVPLLVSVSVGENWLKS